MTLFMTITLLEIVSFILMFMAIIVKEHRGRLCAAGLASWILSHIVGAVWKHFLF